MLPLGHIFCNISYVHWYNSDKTKTTKLERLNKKLHDKAEQLKEKAERDPLTGALNRAGIESILSDENANISIAFIDIDHFKKINDNHGHAIGDEVLTNFAHVINKHTRSSDLLVRWGGEEFLLVCPNTNLSQISQYAETTRERIESFYWPNGIQLTASFGVAQRRAESAETFIDRADQALYQAKKQGRNRVVVSKQWEWTIGLSIDLST